MFYWHKSQVLVPSRKPFFFPTSHGTNTKNICVSSSVVLVPIWPFDPLITLEEDTRCVSPDCVWQAAFPKERSNMQKLGLES